MATIYEIADKYKLIQQLIEDGAPEEAFAEALNSIDGELSEKLENYAMVIKNIESDIAGLKAEEGRLNERRKSMEGNVKRMKLAMQDALLASGQNSLKGEKFSFNIQKNPPSLSILGENSIPKEFVTYESVKNIDKKGLLAHIKEHGCIDGIEVKQTESIRIR